MNQKSNVRLAVNIEGNLILRQGKRIFLIAQLGGLQALD
jgi:hypothetical protein